jgi:ketosteroid isomerase-like protein
MDELVALETAGWDALCTTDGAEFYDGLMTDDGVMLFPMGVFDRAESLQAIAAASPWSSFQLESVQVIHPAPDVGILIYRAVASRGASDPYEAWMSSTYVRDETGKWRLALHQQSPG